MGRASSCASGCASSCASGRLGLTHVPHRSRWYEAHCKFHPERLQQLWVDDTAGLVLTLPRGMHTSGWPSLIAQGVDFRTELGRPEPEIQQMQ